MEGEGERRRKREGEREREGEEEGRRERGERSLTVVEPVDWKFSLRKIM